MRSLLRPAIAAGCALALLALAGCATREQQLAAEIERGPELNVHGRISARQVGKPVLLASYEWSRGPGLRGWTERFTLRNPDGTRMFFMVSDQNGVLVKYQDRARKVESMSWLLKNQLGIDLDPAEVAGWFENRHEGGEVPDRFDRSGFKLEVLERYGDGRPSQVRMVQGETIVLMSIRRDFA